MADLSTLDPWLSPFARWLYRYGKQFDGRLVVTSARRSSAKQAELRRKWETGESQIPANRPGTSLHEFGLAFDMARLGINPLQDPLLMYLGEVWEWMGGRHGGVRDPVHFQPRM